MLKETDFQSLDDDTYEVLRQLEVNTETLGVLQGLYDKIQAQGVSRDIVVAIESMTGEALNENYPNQSFTVQPSEINKEIALEGLITSIFKAAFQGIAYIFKLITKLLRFLIKSIVGFVTGFFGKGRKESIDKSNVSYDSIATRNEPQSNKVNVRDVEEIFSPNKNINKDVLVKVLLRLKAQPKTSADELSKILSQGNQDIVFSTFKKEIDEIEKSYLAWLDNSTWLKTHPSVPDYLYDLEKLIHTVAFSELIVKKDPKWLSEWKGPMQWVGISLIDKIDPSVNMTFQKRIDYLTTLVKKAQDEREVWIHAQYEKLSALLHILEKMSGERFPGGGNLFALINGVITKILEKKADPDAKLFEDGVLSLKVDSFQGDLEEEVKILEERAKGVEKEALKMMDALKMKTLDLEKKLMSIYYPDGGEKSIFEAKSFEKLALLLHKDLELSGDDFKNFILNFSKLRIGINRLVMARKAGERDSLAIIELIKNLSKKIVLKDFKVHKN